MLARLLDSQAEIICCPEAHDNFLGDGWHGAFSDPDYGYPLIEGRRKVTLWSKQPWRDVDVLGSAAFPPGRFVAATTATENGDVRVVAVCIPWRMAHVATGARNRTVWEDHRAFLEGLPEVLADHSLPLVVVGDFNQRIPSTREPKDVAEKLRKGLSDLRVWTQGAIPDLANSTVCHIGGSDRFDLVRVHGMSRSVDGVTLSDHDGIVAEVMRR